MQFESLSTRSTPRGTSARPHMVGSDGVAERDGAQQVERLLAILLVVLLGWRYPIQQGLTVGAALAAVLIVVWFPHLKRYRGAVALMVLLLLCIVSGLILNEIARPTNTVSTSHIVEITVPIIGLMVGLGGLLWARSALRSGEIAVWFGIGMLLAVGTGGSLFSVNAWRFGFSVPVTVIGLGIAMLVGRRWLEIVLIATLAGASALAGGRSSAAILLICAMLVIWQARPRSSGRGSTVRTLLALAVVGYLVYQLGQSLIVDGFLGDDAQERTLAQIDASGSLILGGRPEIAATAALMASRWWGFGSGALPTSHDLAIAKRGLYSIGYDPDNGYVENYMFGSGFELHSSIGDLWATFGVVGLFFAGTVLVLVLKNLGYQISQRVAPALLIFLAIKSLWNLFFSPLYSSLPLLLLLLALLLPLRGSDEGSDGAEGNTKVLAVDRKGT